MSTPLHANLKQLLGFLRDQRESPPEIFTVGKGIVKNPKFFSVKALQKHLNNPLLSPDWLQVRANGNLVPLERLTSWKLVQKKKLVFMDKGPINDLIANGASVVLEGLDILDDGINSFVGAVDRSFPCVLSNAVAFFSQRGHEAYGGHVDSDDVLVVQISGQKEWRIFEPQARRYLDTEGLSASRLGNQLEEFTMNPGDALYVRAGVPHVCRTKGKHSLHMAFDLIDRTPNIEQITAEANKRYNHQLEQAYAGSDAVIDHYISTLSADDFKRELAAHAKNVGDEAKSFREQIGRSSCITAMNKFAD